MIKTERFKSSVAFILADMDANTVIERIAENYNVSEFTAMLFVEANKIFVERLKSGQWKLKEKKKKLNKNMSFEEQMKQFNITAVAKGL